MADDNRPIALADLDDQEESVRIAVKALGDMRNGGRAEPNPRTLPPLSISSSSTSSVKSPRLTSPASSSRSRDSSLLSEASSSAPAFVSRMSSLPLLGSAMRVYEQGKASSRVVKYGAEMMESSVKAVSRPVIDRLPVNVNQLDDFACRQLDRLDRYRRPSIGAEATASPNSTMTTSLSTHNRGRPKLKTKTLDGTAIEEDEDIPENAPSYSSNSRRHWEGSDRDVPSWLEASSPFVAPPPPPPPPDSRASTPTQNGDADDDDKSHRSTSSGATTGGIERQVAQRSRWQAVLLEAGGLSAALSEESMRRLKYCLQWLQYATAHIDAQILILRDFTASLQPLPSSSSSSVTRRPPISEEHLRKLTVVRRDIVHTIRQVVDVVSKYTGGALPEPARTRVRGFILKLPQRWANKAGPAAAGVSASSSASVAVGLTSLSERETVAAAAGHGTGALRRPGGHGQRRAAQRERGTGAPEPGMRSGPNSRAASPSSSPRFARATLTSNRHGDAAQGDTVSASAALVASQRILTLATESLDMMRNVTSVVKDSLDRADAWVGRLRTVGIQRGAQEGEDIPEHDMASEFGFPHSEHMRHRRTGSTSTAFSDADAEHDIDHDPEHDGGIPSSPFFSSTASTTWGSSIPSTPGGGTYTPGGGGFGSGAAAGGYGSGYNTTSGGAVFEKGIASYAGAPSPGSVGAIPIGAMSLVSRYNTPRSVVAGLPEEEEEGAEGDEAEKSGSTVVREVRIVVGAEEDEEERGVQRMEVDV